MLELLGSEPSPRMMRAGHTTRHDTAPTRCSSPMVTTRIGTSSLGRPALHPSDLVRRIGKWGDDDPAR